MLCTAALWRTRRSRKLSNLEMWAFRQCLRDVNPRKAERSKVMPLIQVVLVLIVVGVLLWLVNRFIPMQGTIKSILNGVVVIALVLWLINAFG
ncbi:MAG: Thivi_2564 family membrane protein, partial [Silvibacterium sp.]